MKIFKRRNLRAAIVATAAISMFALGASSAGAQLQPLPDFNFSATGIGAIAIDDEPDGSAHAVWVADNTTAVPELVKLDSITLDEIYGIAPDAFGNSGVLAGITGVAVDQLTNDVIISDGAHQRILRIDPSVGYAIDQAPAPMTNCNAVACPAASAADGSFNAPAGLDVAEDSAVVVADSGNARVQSFDDALAFTGKFTGPDWTGATPIDTAIDPQSDHIFVSLAGVNRVDEFDAAGAFVKTFAAADAASGPTSGIVVDPKSKLLYVAKSSKLDVYSKVTGALVNTLPLPAGVKDIAINTVSRVLYVSIAGTTNTVKRFSYDTPPTCNNTVAATLKNDPVALTLDCSDSTGSLGKQIELVSGPANGTLALDAATGAATYTPAKNFTGTDEFTFRGTTINGVSNVFTGTISVIPKTPIVHVSGNLGATFGEVFFKLPGTDTFQPLLEDQLVPLGTIIDASGGHCITTFANADKSLYASTFWGGVFEMGQGVGDTPPAVMKLRDDQVADAEADNARASIFTGGVKIAAKKKKKKKSNKVWGDGKGNFTTTGNGGSASVRGTRWMVENFATGTLFKVAKGKVLVRDYAKHKSITLKIGDSYFAEKKPKKKKKKK